MATYAAAFQGMTVDSHIKIAQSLTDLLENKFGIGKLRIGLDPLVGLIPGVGDVITLGLSLYIVWIGVQLKLPQEKLVEMIRNVVTDFILGVIPFVGDVADFFYKANRMNMKIIEEHTNKIVEGEVVK
jgi:hypothetical protein